MAGELVAHALLGMPSSAMCGVLYNDAGVAVKDTVQKDLVRENMVRQNMVANKLVRLETIQDLAPRLRRKEVSPVELTKDCLERIEKLNPVLNAFITVTAELALQQAKQAEAEIQRGQWRGPLHGIPVGLKDLIDTAGIR